MRCGIFAAVLLLTAAGTASAAPARNLILISIDDLREDRTIPGSPLTPELQRFAGQAAVFESAFSPASWTLPAHSSLLTGLDPVSHGGGGTPGRPREMSAKVKTLAERLKTAGFATAGFYNSDYVGPRTGMQRGFDTYVNPQPESVFARALSWLRHPPSRRWFLFVHTRAVHAYLRHPGPEAGPPYSCPLSPPSIPYPDFQADPSDAQCLHQRRAYDHAVRCDDAELGVFFDSLEKLGLLKDTAVAVSSDHGEALCEGPSRRQGHAQPGFEDQTRVLMLVRYPSVLRPGRYAGLASLTDMTPTLLETAGLGASRPSDGFSLVALSTGAPSARMAVLSEGEDWISVRGKDLRLLAVGGKTSFYSADGTPAAAEAHPESAALLNRMFQERRARAKAAARPMDLDPLMRDRLRKDGYFP